MQNSPTEPPVKHIVVVGGGTAGWMTALLLSTSKFGARLKVTVLESPTVGVIGVGEGSTPWLRGFFDSLAIDESEWMPACNATYKSGITFDGWSTRPGYESYFHPFPSMLDSLTTPQFLRNVHARLNGADVHAHPDRFFMSQRVAVEGRAPRPAHEFPFDIGYGYHFDATLLGAFLHAKALARGVEHMARDMNSATLDERGDIRALELDGGDSLAADFFVDCSGFASLLVGQALKTPYVSFSDMLFNDAAIAMPTPDDDGPLMSQTVSTGLKHGWAWRLPLTSRFGNGYVYSSAHVSADAAETELRTHLGLLDADVPARHLKMRVGRHAKHWNRNCVAIGLSQGFIEPLEATELLFVQRAAASFVDVLERGDLGDALQAAFNDGLNARVDGVRDYIVTHYKSNTRTDTDYWRANAANNALSEPLQLLLRTWLSSQPIAPGIENGTFGTGCATLSWYCLLAGVGLFPEVRQRGANEAGADLAGIDDLIQRSTPNFPDHRAWLRVIPPHAERIDLWRQPADAGRRATLGAL
ncbi:MAG: tryptophan 7-halogenase [Pseudomonadota bacterium]|nr:tryptophan 7-halogenase [Pseudomonadota bacterium]